MRRFELTIPLKKLLVVKYRDVMGVKDVQVAYGYPIGVRQAVIYLGTPGKIQIIPIACLFSIEAMKTAEDNAW